MTDGYAVVATAVGIMALYGWLCVRMSALVQPLRMELAELGEKLLANPALGQGERGVLQMMLDRAFSTRIAWFFALAFVPAVIFSLSRTRRNQRPANRLDRETDAELSRAYRLGFVSIMANSPAAAVLFGLEVVLSALLLVPVGRAIRALAELVLGPRGSDNGKPQHATVC